ncbi:MAG TPA: PAS domain S-box protein [Blastocatellia bacterium]|nr:PAS domain S-box protein [Blastocatellia bacterium]
MDTQTIAIPGEVVRKWQDAVNLLSEILQSPTVLVVRTAPPHFRLIASSDSPSNPYKAGDLAGDEVARCCESVLAASGKVAGSNPQANSPLNQHSHTKGAAASCLGLPMQWPDGDVFGVICVFGDRRSSLDEFHRRVVTYFRDASEADLRLLYETERRAMRESPGQIERAEAWRESVEELAEANARLRQEVADRTKAEQELREGKEWFERLFEDSPFPFWEMDLSGVKKYVDVLRAQGFDPRQYIESHPEAALECAQVTRHVRFNRATLRLNEVETERELFTWLASALMDESQAHINNFRSLVSELAGGSTEFELESVTPTIGGKVVDFVSRVVVLPGCEETWSRVLVSTLDLTERKRSEEAMAHLAAIVESSDDAIIGKSLDDKIVSWNKGARQLYGYSTEEAIGRPISILAAPGHEDDLQTIFERLNRGESVGQFEAAGITKDGRLKDISLTVSPIKDSRGAVIGASAIARDITERKGAEEALRQSQQEYSNLVNSIDGIVWQADANTFAFSFVSRHAERMLGYPVHRWLNEPDFWRNHIHPDDRHWVIELCRRATAEKKGQEFQYRMLHPDGRVVWLHDFVTVVAGGDRPVELRGVMVDITERKKAEESLRKSEEEHRLFFELDVAGNYISTPEGAVTNCNPAFVRMFGFDSVEEAVKDGAASLYPSPEARQAFVDLVKRQERLEYFEKELRRKDGSVIHVIENVIGSFNEDGSLAEIRGYLMDDTERRKVEQQFRQSQKLEAIGQLAGGIAHDFNNLMTIILGYSQLLLRRLAKSDPNYVEALEIRKAGARAAALTGQLLAFSRKQILQPRVINLNEVVADLDKMLRRIIGEDIDLATVTDPKAGLVKADPGQIEQVIVNLAVNARDAMPTGGRLTIETANVYLDENYSGAHVGTRPGQYVMLAISDNGSGMDEKVQAHVFEPFFTTKHSGKGTGLGLSTVYGIVKQSGGNIWVYSEPGQGTTFKVYLPRVDAPPDSHAQIDLGDHELHGAETVLLVEDDAAVRQLAAVALREAGFTVIEASSGDEALRLVTEPRGACFEMLVTDVVMPGTGGKELADRVKAARPDVKALFITGYTDNAIVHHGRLSPGIDILQKPFTPSDLVRKVREVLDADSD